jgi:hypothetical protein
MPFLTTKVEQLGLLEVRMEFHLVAGRLDTAIAQQHL